MVIDEGARGAAGVDPNNPPDNAEACATEFVQINVFHRVLRARVGRGGTSNDDRRRGYYTLL